MNQIYTSKFRKCETILHKRNPEYSCDIMDMHNMHLVMSR